MHGHHTARCPCFIPLRVLAILWMDSVTYPMTGICFCAEILLGYMPVDSSNRLGPVIMLL